MSTRRNDVPSSPMKEAVWRTVDVRACESAIDHGTPTAVAHASPSDQRLAKSTGGSTVKVSRGFRLRYRTHTMLIVIETTPTKPSRSVELNPRRP
jgi:hypothetical protein